MEGEEGNRTKPQAECGRFITVRVHDEFSFKKPLFNEQVM